jgi:pyrroline-5-carboxylate reductase
MNKICFIGAGNMASSIISGLITKFNRDQLIATTKTLESANKLAKKYNIYTTTDNKLAVKQADIIIICVKPNIVKELITEITPELNTSKLIISVVAGIPIKTILNWCGQQLAIVRAMPNTPAVLLEAATGLYANQQVSAVQKEMVTAIFSAIGQTEWVADESLIDVVTAVSGSGPAYYFLFMEIMAKIANKMGLDKDTAIKFTKQTALGAAKLATISDQELSQLRKQVTSPGGTTEQAITSFIDNNLEDIITKAMHAAADRAKLISSKFK